jgi:AcrR family transcriptional regulator
MRPRSQTIVKSKLKPAAAKKPVKGSERRVRRTAEEARRLILDAAEERLAREGPEGIRLQDIAADIGISHPAILHHFESREGLMRALIQRSSSELRDRLFTLLLKDHNEQAATIIAKVFEILSDRGTARLIAWLQMTGRSNLHEGSQHLMVEIADRVHQERIKDAQKRNEPTPKREETLFMAMLVANAAIGDAIVGHQLAEAAGLDKNGVLRFRRWLAGLLSSKDQDSS